MKKTKLKNEDGDIKEQCKERLKNIVAKKFVTATIYPLSQFEMVFGDIWGNNLPDESLTEEQRVNRAKYEQCRKNILDLGNKQKRNCLAEIDLHEIYWNRYQTMLVPIEKYKELGKDGEKNA